MSDFVDAQTVANYFGIALQTVYNLANRRPNPMPHSRLGISFRFRLAEVEAWSQRQRAAMRPTVRPAPKPDVRKASRKPEKAVEICRRSVYD